MGRREDGDLPSFPFFPSPCGGQPLTTVLYVTVQSHRAGFAADLTLTAGETCAICTLSISTLEQTMELRLDPSSPDPLNRQIVDQIRHQIATGKLRTSERLPPVRVLAAQLKLNVNTVARAYLELERSEVLFTAHGRGTFVADEASGRL